MRRFWKWIRDAASTPADVVTEADIVLTTDEEGNVIKVMRLWFRDGDFKEYVLEDGLTESANWRL